MKLVKANGFNRPPECVVHTGQPASEVVLHLAVVVLKNGHVEVAGHVQNQALALEVLAKGAERLKQWHAQQQAKLESRIVGLDGLPLTHEGGEA